MNTHSHSLLNSKLSFSTDGSTEPSLLSYKEKEALYNWQNFRGKPGALCNCHPHLPTSSPIPDLCQSLGVINLSKFLNENLDNAELLKKKKTVRMLVNKASKCTTKYSQDKGRKCLEEPGFNISPTLPPLWFYHVLALGTGLALVEHLHPGQDNGLTWQLSTENLLDCQHLSMSMRSIFSPLHAAGPGRPHQGCLGSSHMTQLLPMEFGQSLRQVYWLEKQNLLPSSFKSCSICM